MRPRNILCVGAYLFLLAPACLADKMLSADALYPDRENPEASLHALKMYEEILTEGPGNVEALWKAARASWWVGTGLKNRPDRLAAFMKGMAYAQRAAKLKPDAVEVHFWLASNDASYGHVKGAFTSLRLISEIRREMAIVLQIQPSYMGGGADRVLGILDYKVPGFLGGNSKRALAHLEKSLAWDPQNPVTIYYLADFYADEGNKQKALSYLDDLGHLTPSPDFKPELPSMLELAKTLRARLDS